LASLKFRSGGRKHVGEYVYQGIGESNFSSAKWSGLSAASFARSTIRRLRIFASLPFVYPRRTAEFLHRVSRMQSVYAPVSFRARPRRTPRDAIAHKDNKHRSVVRLLFLKPLLKEKKIRSTQPILRLRYTENVTYDFALIEPSGLVSKDLTYLCNVF